MEEDLRTQGTRTWTWIQKIFLNNQTGSQAPLIEGHGRRKLKRIRADLDCRDIGGETK